jgi:hypothetical protein
MSNTHDDEVGRARREVDRLQQSIVEKLRESGVSHGDAVRLARQIRRGEVGPTAIEGRTDTARSLREHAASLREAAVRHASLVQRQGRAGGTGSS